MFIDYAGKLLSKLALNLCTPESQLQTCRTDSVGHASRSALVVETRLWKNTYQNANFETCHQTSVKAGGSDGTVARIVKLG